MEQTVDMRNLRGRDAKKFSPLYTFVCCLRHSPSLLLALLIAGRCMIGAENQCNYEELTQLPVRKFLTFPLKYLLANN